ncbi:hypothetical protein ACH5RR_033611 [Cinchona calisaya]|uniref:Fcf2 pre-rRNA processing C-terminal domain-containing protein n=1 Tax=Cinchona calisaya TaxID=153742 RepID=A0ABD2YLF3_9GENT
MMDPLTGGRNKVRSMEQKNEGLCGLRCRDKNERMIDLKRGGRESSSTTTWDVCGFSDLVVVGTEIESASEFCTGRLTKKERKATLADELLSDSNLAPYRR